MGNYSCCVCGEDTGIKLGISGKLESKIEWCPKCEVDIIQFIDQLKGISSNKLPFNQSGTIFNSKKSDLELLKRCVVEIKKRLSENETILDFVSVNNGTISLTGGMMVMTNKKLFFFTVTTSGFLGTKGLGCKSEFTSNYSNIVNFELKNSLQGLKIKLSVKGDRDIDDIYCQNRNEVELFKSKFQSKLGEEPQSDTIVHTSDNLDKIKKLKELFDMGVINEQEFEEKKTKLLEGI